MCTVCRLFVCCIIDFHNGSYSFYIVGVSSGVDYVDNETVSGTGDAYWISLFSPSATIATGIYTYASGDDANHMDPYTFEDLWIMINYNFETDVGDAYMAEAGTVTITEVGDSTISLTFEVSLDDGNTATGTWTGAVTKV